MVNWQQIEQLADITVNLPRFSDALQRLTARLGLEIAGLDADHISLRCHQNTTAERWRRGLEQCEALLSENMINGRSTCLFRLAEPVCAAHWRFHIIELPWPSEKRYPHEGWEHIEIVLPGDPAVLNAHALALLADDGFDQPGIVVKTSSPRGQHECLSNPILAVADGSVTVKFHSWLIGQIAVSEQANTQQCEAARRLPRKIMACCKGCLNQGERNGGIGDVLLQHGVRPGGRVLRRRSY